MNAQRFRVNILLPVSAFALLSPQFAHAALFEYFENLIAGVDYIVALVLPVLVTLAVLYFFWGLVKFIGKSGDDKAIAEGRSQMVWGVVALFVMVSVWGIVALLATLFDVSYGGQVAPPGVADEDDEGRLLPFY
jgi:hypothetical protein